MKKEGWKRGSPCPTLVVLGSGGHTTEMLTVVKSMDRRMYSPRIYVMAKSDALSRKKVEEVEGARGDFVIEALYRIREVGQSWTSTFLHSAPIACLQSEAVVRRHAPALILCNGPGICVPVCLFGRLYKILFGLTCSLVYIESICRVKKLSLTGKILRTFADHFFVQWPELQREGDMYLGRIS